MSHLIVLSGQGQRQHAGRRGVTLVEVIVAVAVILFLFLFLVMMLPRGREEARMTSCRNNLGQIGKALAIYDQLEHQLPTVFALSSINGPAGNPPPGPLRTLLQTLELPDLTQLKDAQSPLSRRPDRAPVEIPVPGFICPSDPNATAGRFMAPISYRATTGADPAGDDGPFAIGRMLGLGDVEAADGLSYTAGFSERLVGDQQPNHPAPCNYRVVPGRLAGSACPGGGPSDWRGDAGSSWTRSDYRHTLYNHALPLSSAESCVAADGKTAFMGASSGHLRGINLLLLDGSVTTVTRSIDHKLWKQYAQITPQARLLMPRFSSSRARAFAHSFPRSSVGMPQLPLRGERVLRFDSELPGQ